MFNELNYSYQQSINTKLLLKPDFSLRLLRKDLNYIGSFPISTILKGQDNKCNIINMDLKTQQPNTKS